MRHKIGHPHYIDPSLIEIGDEVIVHHKPKRGITMTLTGIVAKRVDEGATRYLSTKEGSTLLAWSPKKNADIKVVLLSREASENTALFNLPEEVERRIA